jgi:hypothetical protein
MQLAVASALTANQSRDDMLREYDIEIVRQDAHRVERPGAATRTPPT